MVVIDLFCILGSGLLVAPVTGAGKTSVDVYLPGGDDTLWYDTRTWDVDIANGYVSFPVDMDFIPVLQRGGSILPKQERVRRSAPLMLGDPYTLIVAPDKSGQANGTLFIDDGHTYRYRKGEYLYLKLEFKDNKLTSRKVDSDGSYETPSWLEKVVIAGIAKKPSAIVLNSGNYMPPCLNFHTVN